MSRRAADSAVAAGRVRVNGLVPDVGQTISPGDLVHLDGGTVSAPVTPQTIILHKPVGYVVSRRGQGAKTIYSLLPPEYHGLKPVGRLDKDSSGLLILTNDGQLHQQLSHPSYRKKKIYHVTLDKPLQKVDFEKISGPGVLLEDGASILGLSEPGKDKRAWIVTMHEGRNRQIRRTFAELGYQVQTLHRLSFGPYDLEKMKRGEFQLIP